MSRTPQTKARRQQWDTRPRKEKAAIRHTLFLAQYGICQICDKALDEESATIDHKRSLARGGSACAVENLQLVHAKCNTLKASGSNVIARRKLGLSDYPPGVRHDD